MKESNTTKKVLLLSNSFWYLYNFRLPLINKLNKDGYQLILVAPRDKYLKYFLSYKYKVVTWDLNRSSINIFNEIKSVFNLYEIYKSNPVDLYHNFTIKPCIYGTLVAKLFKNSKILNSITGLGHLFLSNKFHIRFLRFILLKVNKYIYRSKNVFTIFQNTDDFNFFANKNIIYKKNSFLIPGSGVDTNFYKTTTTKKNKSDNYNILFPSRIIKEKGILEVCEAVDKLNKKGYKIIINVAGETDKGNRSFIKKEEISSLFPFLEINYLGHIKDMRRVYISYDLIILPSWREGLSMALLESASMECPIITSNISGCKDIVVQGKTGLLVPLRNSEAIELSIEILINNPKFARRMGKAARKRVVELFSKEIILENHIKLYKKILN